MDHEKSQATAISPPPISGIAHQVGAGALVELNQLHILKAADRYQETTMTDAYTKAVLTVIALALTMVAIRPLVEPQRVQAEGPTPVEISQRLGKLEHNAEVMRSAANTNARRTNERFAKQGLGVDVVLVEADAAGLMGARSELAIQTPPPPPNPF